jgi:hypothetical protein
MAIDPITKAINENHKQLVILQKENKELKKILKTTERKVDLILDKIQEFEVVFDAAELIEEQIEKQNNESEYNSEWSPYDDEDFNPEDYENYDEDDDDSSFNNGY